MERIDYLSDDDGDLRIENGDFVKGDATFQYIKDLCNAGPGNWRQYPEIWFLIARFKNSGADRKSQFVSELTQQLEAIGIKVNSIDVSAKEWWKNFIVTAE
jgi:hypothetical protein